MWKTRAAASAIVGLLVLGGAAAVSLSGGAVASAARSTAGPAHSGQPARSGRLVRVASSQSVAEIVRSGGQGFWAVYPGGAVVADSPAPVLGDASGAHLNQPIVGATGTPDSAGYWLVASDGGVFPFGDARFFGSTGNVKLNRPVVGMASTPDGGGYWLVASDGGVFPFGDARFFGSTGNVKLNRPVVGMAATPDGAGYWLVASDGGIFEFGDAHFFGSTGNVKLNRPVVGMSPSTDGAGYWLVASDGGIFNFGDAHFQGSATNIFATYGESGVGVTCAGNGGYWVQSDAGSVAPMDAPLTASAPTAQPASSPSAPLPPNQDPSSSQPPSGGFYANCFGSGYNATACDQAALSDIDSALQSEGYAPLSLPSNYESLSMDAQLVAVANAERVVRGLPAMPEDGTLDSMAYNGARNGTDPTGPPGYTWGSNLAMGYPTALSADYVWMYDDGANSPNVDCQSAGSSGCWGHRHNVLIQGAGSSGGGMYNDNGTLDLTQLFAVGYP